MQQTALPAALLEVLRHARTVGGRQGRFPDGCGWIPTELERRVEVLRSKRAQSERRSDERGFREGDGRVIWDLSVRGNDCVDGRILRGRRFHPE